MRAFIALVCAAAAVCLPAAADTRVAEELVVSVAVSSDAGFMSRREDAIEATFYRPEGKGPFPLLVLSHGSPRLASERRSWGRVRFEAQSRIFVGMGYAIAVPTRRGYGGSQGSWAEGYGSCAQPDYHAAGLETARDILATVEAARKLPWIDGSKVVLAGISAGGWGSVAAAATPVAGLAGVINFAGGRGSQAPDTVCNEGALIDAVRRYGRASRVPQLWVYSANDRYFGPALARRMHDAFVAAGGVADLVQAPAHGDDGHLYFARAPGDWKPTVERFLRR